MSKPAYLTLRWRDNPYSRHLGDYLDQRVLFYKTRDEKELIQINSEAARPRGEENAKPLDGVLLGILIVAVPTAFTQQQSERIQLGTDLQIGMARDAIIYEKAVNKTTRRQLIYTPECYGVLDHHR